MIRIVEIKDLYTSFVAKTIIRRWDVTEKQAWNYIYDYILKKNNSNCFVSVDGKVPVGMGTFHVNNDIGVDLHPWCIGLWVKPNYRGNGIGIRITLKRFDWARKLGYKKIYLDTINAEKYHLKFGWKNTNIIGYYKNEPTMVMEHYL